MKINEIKLNKANPRLINMLDLPYINEIESNYKIVLDSGQIYYAHNIKSNYNYNERIEIIRNFKNYFQTPKQQAYETMLWDLFEEFLNAYSFAFVDKMYKKFGKNKDLYVLRNSLGFIKVGVAKNVNQRIKGLKSVFGGEWTLLKLYKDKGTQEGFLHSKLMNYVFPIKKNYTNEYSSECFIDCSEVLNIIELETVN